MNELELDAYEILEKKVERYDDIKSACTAITILAFLISLALLGSALSLVFLGIGLISIVWRFFVKSNLGIAERAMIQVWKDSIDHTPGAETAQCNACFGPVFADATRCCHCGASFVDTGPTIIPFIGIGF